MSAFTVQGWCPGALRPMMSGDGLVVRIRPHLARLTAEQAQGVANAALRHGNGLIDLSARANVQVRGIRPEAHPDLLADLNKLGLIDPDPATEAHRNLVVSPFWTDQDGTPKVAGVLAHVLQDAAFADLSGKFGVAVDLGPAATLHAVSADIRVERAPGGWLLRPDSFSTGAVVTTLDGLAHAARDLIAWFLGQDPAPQRRGRMAGLWAGMPQPERGQRLPDWLRTGQASTASAPQSQPGPHPLGCMVGFEFGQLRAEVFGALATTALRITPWRMILLEGASHPPAVADLITDPNDPLLRVMACTGAPGCPQALQPTRELARALAPEVPKGQLMHVSGCAKGCAHPRVADVTLCATPSGFDVIRSGCAGDAAQASFDRSISLFKAL